MAAYIPTYLKEFQDFSTASWPVDDDAIFILGHNTDSDNTSYKFSIAQFKTYLATQQITFERIIVTNNAVIRELIINEDCDCVGALTAGSIDIDGGLIVSLGEFTATSHFDGLAFIVHSSQVTFESNSFFKLDNTPTTISNSTLSIDTAPTTVSNTSFTIAPTALFNNNGGPTFLVRQTTDVAINYHNGFSLAAENKLPAGIDSAVIDTHTGWNSSAREYTIQEDGTYSFDSVVTIQDSPTGVPTDSLWYIYVVINTTNLYMLQKSPQLYYDMGQSSDMLSKHSSKVFYNLSAGDVVSLRCSIRSVVATGWVMVIGATDDTGIYALPTDPRHTEWSLTKIG